MRIFRYIVLPSFLLGAILFLPTMSPGADYKKGNFSVYQYMDRLSFSENDPIILHICIKNISKKKQVLKIYDARYTSFHPVLYDAGGREAKLIVQYRLKNKKMGDYIKGKKPRIVELAQNEVLEHTLDLRRIYKIGADNEYRVEVGFYPDAKKKGMISGDNILTFKTFYRGEAVKYRAVKRIGTTVSPEEVVMLFLHAEKNSNWDYFLKYIKLEEYIKAYPDYVNIYDKANERKKGLIIDEFIKFLKRDRSDYIIDFDVVNEIIKGDNSAFVDARIKRYGPRVPFVYKYRYTLERFRSFWRIIDVEATVIKGYKS